MNINQREYRHFKTRRVPKIVTQPMAFDYEISAAILFMLQEEYDELIVDMPRGEDSIFFSGPKIGAVGEAKNVSKKHWTLNSLFHTGQKIGPILQLWIRRKEGAKLAILSTVGTKVNLEKHQLRPNNDELRMVIENTKNLDCVIRDSDYTLKQVTKFVKNLYFYEWPHRTVKSSIHKWCRDHDLTLVQNGIEKAIALFQDETYFHGKRIQRYEIIDALNLETAKLVQPDRRYYTYSPAFVVSMNCYGKIAIQLGKILDLYMREMRAQWYDSSKDVNAFAIGVLKERVEMLKNLQERCGNVEIEQLIHWLEEKPHELFKENKSGENLRKTIRILIAHFTRKENDSFYGIQGLNL